MTIGAYEPSEELAASWPQVGQPSRNPKGPPVGAMQRHREIRALLKAGGQEPCGVPGFEGYTKLDYTIWNLWELAMDGERWAVTFISNRLWGRVPTTVELEMSVKKPDLMEASDADLRERIERLRDLVSTQPIAVPEPTSHEGSADPVGD